ncbi:hypothetical protein Scep_026413 [Stephania cephalantha]|uniref:Uncharacterized protein n=1 Tax=Stephania cephalantha TaxID=152367 RepID=A0AAP0ETZ3_9MAGN
MDRSLLAIACASGKAYMHNIVMVIGISNRDELDPSDIFFNPLLFFLFLLSSIKAGVTSNGISVGTIIENISNEMGDVEATSSLGARSTVVAAVDTIRISCTGSTSIVGSVRTTVKTKYARTILRSLVNTSVSGQ